MIWTFLALLSLIALGGFISYYGDLQGRRWGKKRVSWFGLRPKHTAILITSLTGGLIALLSIVTMLVIMPTVREVVLRGEMAIRENRRLEDRIAGNRLEDAKLTREVAARTQQLNLAEKELAEKNRLVAATQKQIERIETLNHALGERNGLLQADNTAMQHTRTQLDDAIKRKQAENAQLAEWNKNAEQINAALGKDNYRLKFANIEITKTNSDLQARNDGLEKKGDVLKREDDALYAESTARQKEIDQLNTQLEAKNARLDTLTDRLEEINNLIRQRDQLYGQIASANRDIAQNYVLLRQGQLNLRSGAELARTTIPAHLRPEAARKQLDILLNSASETARAHGAGKDEDGREVRLVNKQLVTLTGVQESNEESRLDSLANRLAGGDAPVVVVANAVNNSIKGEPVVVEVSIHDVQRVFDRGAKVATRRIDTRQPMDKIIEDVLQFLQTDVRDAAIKAGTIPRVDPETGAQEVGIVGAADLFQLTERVRKLGGEAMLTATAKADLSSADALNLSFHVARIPESKL